MTDNNERAANAMSTLPDDMERIFTALETQSQQIAALAQPADAQPGCDKLFKALAKAQSEIQNAVHDAEAKAGPYSYKYATLDAVLEAVRGPLSKNGLSFMQLPGRVMDGDVELLSLTTIIGHESGQSIENYFEMYPPKRDPQGIGSAMTYMRRYVLMAMCGIAGANDDDAEKTLPEEETISAAQADQIFNLADDLFGDDAEALLERMCDKIFQVDAVAKIPAKEFDVAIMRIENTRKRKDREKQQKKPDAKKPEATKKPASEPSA
jgi:hypothetical protein